MKNEKFMKIAIEEAYSGIQDGHGGPFGAVIVKGDVILARAHNTVLRDNDPTQHAEIRAISMAAKKLGSYDLSGCVIFSTTEPCPMCFSAIHWARIENLYFGTTVEDVRELGFNELVVPVSWMKEKGQSSMIVTDGFLTEECYKLLKDWQNMPDKKVY